MVALQIDKVSDILIKDTDSSGCGFVWSLKYHFHLTRDSQWLEARTQLMMLREVVQTLCESNSRVTNSSKLI